jgi:hypothetical protein
MVAVYTTIDLTINIKEGRVSGLVYSGTVQYPPRGLPPYRGEEVWALQ